MDQKVYIPLEQPIEGLPNTTEMMHNKYDLKSLMDNSSIQNSSPEFIKIFDQNLIIDDDDLIFENIQQNEADDITDEEQNLILSAFQSVITPTNSSSSALNSANSPNRVQISMPNQKIVKSKMYQIEEPFFKDFDDFLPPQPPSYDDHIDAMPGFLHRPILPIDTLFPTDDMMYQNGSLIMQNGEKYVLTNDNQYNENGYQESEVIPQGIDSSMNIAAKSQDNSLINQQLSPSISIQAIPTPTQNIAQPVSSQEMKQPTIPSYMLNGFPQQNTLPYLINPAQQANLSPYAAIPQVQQTPLQQNLNSPDSSKPLFQISQPPQLPPFMPPPLDDITLNHPTSDEPSYRNFSVQQPNRNLNLQPNRNSNAQPSYRPIEKPKYPQLGIVPENSSPPQAQNKPQKLPQNPPQQQNTTNDSSDVLFSEEPANPKKKRKMEAMPC